jgi:aldehyde dehydrogenase (NAD+)
MSETTTTAAYEDLERMLIGGAWRRGRGDSTIEDRDPYTDEVLLAIPAADERDLDDAFRAAANAQPAWASVVPSERAAVIRRVVDILDQRREEIVHWLVRESGSTRIKAAMEWQIARAITLESSTFPSRVDGSIRATDIPGKESRIVRHAVGVVGMISPWNFPFHLSSRSIAPAIAVGNAVVIKPSSDTPVTGGTLLAKIYEEAGVPAGVINVVVGQGSTVGDAFIRHPCPRVLSFTGSTTVGKHIAQLAAKGEILKRVLLELGGNCPCVVLDDADVELAVNIAVFGKFLHQGQICMAINRLIVDERVHDAFVDRFVGRVGGLKAGNPADDDTVVGPLINQGQVDGLMKRIGRSRSEGAEQVLGGPPRGRVVPPHVFVNVRSDMTIAREELFGPAVGIIKVRGDAEAVRVANETEYGLSAAIVTRDLERGNQVAKRIQAGMAHVNDSPVNDLPNCPFGGEKNSGLGRYNGEWIIDEMTTVQWVSVQHTPIEYPF